MQNARKDDVIRTSEPAGTGVDFVAGGSTPHTSEDRPPLRDVSMDRKNTARGVLWRDALRELSLSVVDLAKSDVKLAITEISSTSRNAQRHALQIGVFGALAAIGILPFLAFLVMGIGDLINNYWLSALLVSIFCIGIGGIFAYRAFRQLKEQDFSLSETRRMLDRQFHSIQRKLSETTERRSDRRAA